MFLRCAVFGRSETAHCLLEDVYDFNLRHGGRGEILRVKLRSRAESREFLFDIPLLGEDLPRLERVQDLFFLHRVC